MKVIKDTPKGTSNFEVIEDIVSYMEDKYPEMTSEFKKDTKRTIRIVLT